MSGGSGHRCCWRRASAAWRRRKSGASSTTIRGRSRRCFRTRCSPRFRRWKRRPGCWRSSIFPTRGRRCTIDSSCIVLDAVTGRGQRRLHPALGGRGRRTLVLLTEGCAQAWSPKALRAAMGAHFELTMVERADVARLLAKYSGRVLATRLDRGESLFDLDLAGPVAWLFGSEGAGLSTGAGRAWRDGHRCAFRCQAPPSRSTWRPPPRSACSSRYGSARRGWPEIAAPCVGG
ncbi:MAG: hypothetical protein MZW92_78075 [Comamonadaceae bacterium]|nr:hypothetical protein [Comamonadaceae bacterium]